MMKNFLSSLLLGAFVFGLGAVDVQVANAASPFKTPAYSQKKPELPKKKQREQSKSRYGGKTQQKYR